MGSSSLIERLTTIDLTLKMGYLILNLQRYESKMDFCEI